MESAWAAVSALLLVRFPRPPALGAPEGRCGQEGWDAGGILVVRSTEGAPKITLLEGDADSDVAGHGESEDEVRGSNDQNLVCHERWRSR